VELLESFEGTQPRFLAHVPRGRGCSQGQRASTGRDVGSEIFFDKLVIRIIGSFASMPSNS
jgi:hypothetical protein